MSQLAIKVLQAIQTALDNDKLVLPSMPEIAMRVREIAQSDTATIQDLSAVIGHDAALSARIVKVANSPLFRATNVIGDLHMALSRLGMEYTSNLAIGLAMEQMFQAKSALIDKKMREVWEKSSEVAGISYVLCKHFTNLSQDQAALAGLVHKIGVLPILAFAEEHPVLLKDLKTLESVVEKVHPAIGVQILTRWDFPVELQKVPEDYVNFHRDIETADYADVVTVAAIQSDPNESKGIDLSTITSFDRLGLAPSIEFTEGEKLSKEMEAARQLLC